MTKQYYYVISTRSLHKKQKKSYFKSDYFFTAIECQEAALNHIDALHSIYDDSSIIFSFSVKKQESGS